MVHRSKRCHPRWQDMQVDHLDNSCAHAHIATRAGDVPVAPDWPRWQGSLAQKP